MLAAAAKGFEIWRRVPASQRAALLRRAAALVRANARETSPRSSRCRAKRFRYCWLRSNAQRPSWTGMLEQAIRIDGRIVPDDRPLQQFVVREPIGPVAAFTPWNVPMSAPSRKISAALASGCSIILKPAEETPRTTSSLPSASLTQVCRGGFEHRLRRSGRGVVCIGPVARHAAGDTDRLDPCGQASDAARGRNDDPWC